MISDRFARRREPIWVRDVILQDPSGQQHGVRIQGDIVAGSLNLGDDVEVEGFNRGGTIVLERGWNRSINAKIIVKRR